MHPRVTSGGATLPLDLAALGALGCALQVSHDLTAVVFGTNQHGVHDLPLSNAPPLVGMQLFQQAAVFSPSNALGIVMSDAAIATIGR